MIYGAARMCKGCNKSIIIYNSTQNLCMACTRKNYKPIPKRGKRAKEYDVWRDKIARPYLDKRYGIACKDCDVMPPKKDDGTYYRHDVDHKSGRGAHAELKYQVTNLVYRCRDCHRKKTDHKA